LRTSPKISVGISYTRHMTARRVHKQIYHHIQ